MKIGILGAGQLGRMIALAGLPLGLSFRFLDPAPRPSANLLGELVTGNFSDEDALRKFCTGIDFATFEFENVPAATARLVSECVQLFPDSQALAASQDRLLEKQLFRDLEIPTAPFAAVDTIEELRSAVSQLGFPALLKTRRLGYDGKGQWKISSQQDIEPVWHEAGATSLIVEAFVPFQRELSVIAVRSARGEIAFYPIVENRHFKGILRVSLAPAPATLPELQEKANRLARKLLDHLNYAGVLALELFQVDGKLLANEFAPRVHNSGHWTIEGAETSQFENHLRAVLGLPLGAVTPRGVSAMINLIGELPDAASVMRIPYAHLHLYDKPERPGRKVGHITIRADQVDVLSESVRKATQLRGVELE